jgi:cellobiose phosphorylase
MKVEPYVYCGNIASPEHKRYGYARNAWLSGTATWANEAGTQWILGIRPTHRGLEIAPVVPEAWRGFQARRIFRGVRYAIAVKRVGRGRAVRLVVDGRLVDGSVVPFPPRGTQDVKVEVRLGEA